MKRDSLKHFMNPGSVAVIGISRRNGPGSYNLMENMLQYGFRGRIFPVNPRADEILGMKAHRHIREIGEPVELAVIGLPRELVLPSIRDCAEYGVKAAIVVGQGFADADDKGKMLQREMASIARSSGLRILGPNTLGVVNNFNNFTTSFMPLTREKGPVGMICQSGLFFVGAGHFVGNIGKGFDIGNGCDVGFCDCLEYLGQDPDIEIIAMHMEGIDHGREFLSVASRVAREKPVLVFKTGRSEAGARAAASHSGSMAGDYDVYQAALKQAGLICLREDGQMHDAVRTLLSQPPLKGDRIAVITVTGAGGIMAGDALEKYGLKPAPLSENTIRTLKKLSPRWMPLGNPLDIWPAAMKHGLREVYALVLGEVLADGNVDGVLCITLAPQLPDFDFLDVSEHLTRETNEAPGKPVAGWLYGPGVEGIAKKFEDGKRITIYRSFERAAWSLALLRERRRFFKRNAAHGTGGLKATDGTDRQRS